MRLLQIWIRKLNLDNKINFSADKIRISVEQILQVLKQVNPTEILDKIDRDEKRLYETLQEHKQSIYLNNCNNN